LFVLICLGVVIFGGLYYTQAEKLRKVVICLTTIIPVFLLSFFFFTIFCVKRKIEEPNPQEVPQIISEFDVFANRLEGCVCKFAASFSLSCFSPAIRLHILVETLSLIK
jgi:hypothetical protein